MNQEQSIRSFVHHIESLMPDEADLRPLHPKSQWEPYELPMNGGSLDGMLCNQAPTEKMAVLAGSYMDDKLVSDAVIAGCSFAGNPDDERILWGIRAYNVGKMEILRTMFRNLGIERTWNDEGHGIYANVRGTLAVSRCVFRDLGGQGMQIVNRPSETTAAPGEIGKGSTFIQRSVFRDCCRYPGRGAVPLTVFNPGGNVSVLGVAIFYTPQFPVFSDWAGSYQSRGGALFGYAADMTQRCPLLVIRNLAIIQRTPDRAAIRFQGQDVVSAEGLYLRDAGSEIAGPKPVSIYIHHDCKKVSLRNVTGDVDIYLDDGSYGGPKLHEIRGEGDYEWSAS